MQKKNRVPNAEKEPGTLFFVLVFAAYRFEAARHAGDFFFVGGKDHLFDVFARLLIQRVRDVFELAVFAFFGGHRDEQAAGTFDDLEVAYDEAIVDRDRDVRFQSIFINRKYLHFSDDHRVVPPEMRFVMPNDVLLMNRVVG